MPESIKLRSCDKDTPQDFQAEYFARCFHSYDETIQSYRLGGGHIPSRHNFNRAKTQNKKSAFATE